MCKSNCPNCLKAERLQEENEALIEEVRLLRNYVQILADEDKEWKRYIN